MYETKIDLNSEQPLREQLAAVPKDTTHLTLAFEEFISEGDWALLSDHFTSVTHFWMSSGFNEMLEDGGIPLHWPLQKLTLDSSCGDTCTSPWILEGKVRHLVLYDTCGLRFEGPTPDELLKVDREAIAKGDKESFKTANGITVTFVSDLFKDWYRQKPLVKDDSEKRDVHLRVLEIVHNDVHDTFGRFILGLASFLDSVETLSIISTSLTCSDLDDTSQDLFAQVFPQLTSLQTLVLILSDRYPDRDQLPKVVRALPRNLEILRFRSSVSLAAHVDVFADMEFLPALKTLSFVLDFEDGETRRKENEERMEKYKTRNESKQDVMDKDENEDEDDIASPPSSVGATVGEWEGDIASEPNAVEMAAVKVSDETLAFARRACERVWRAAESRGVKIEGFDEAWSQEFTGITEVDERWERV